MQTLIDIYQKKTEEGELTFDLDHHELVQELETLSSALNQQHNTSVLSRLLGKKRPYTKGYYIYGEVGRGKSMVMDLFFAHVRTSQKRRVHFHQFMLEVHDFLHQKRNNTQQEGALDSHLLSFAEALAKNVRLLCFDEFHVKDVADAMLLGRLFTALFDRGITVLMTSNIAPDQLYKDGLQRDRFIPFIELLKRKMHIIHFAGKVDYRLQTVRENKTYFSPNDAKAEKAVEDLYQRIRGDHEESAQTLEVKGRKIRIPKAAANIAVFDFDDICTDAKSALDYLELIKYFDVFIVKNVPVLDDDHPNETTRFITFIDTLYDNGAHIIITAAATPETLYRGELNKEVFKRTTSRLIEMQSKEYAQ